MNGGRGRETTTGGKQVKGGRKEEERGKSGKKLEKRGKGERKWQET